MTTLGFDKLNVELGIGTGSTPKLVGEVFARKLIPNCSEPFADAQLGVHPVLFAL